MELQEFIKETLVQITNGTLQAQKALKGTGCLINPEGFTIDESQVKQDFDNEYRALQKIKMSIAVTVNEKSGSTSGINIAHIIKAGINSEESSINNKTTIIEFEIPVALPVMNNEK